MASFTGLDEKTGRKFYVDDADELTPNEKVTFILSLHGGGSIGAWQRAYFPAIDYRDKYRLVIATPSAATKEPARRWVAEADDEHLHNIVNFVFDKYGKQNIRSFWLAGHSQGGMTSRRLLGNRSVLSESSRWLAQPFRRSHRHCRTRTGFRRADAAGREVQPSRIPAATGSDLRYLAYLRSR